MVCPNTFSAAFLRRKAFVERVLKWALFEDGIAEARRALSLIRDADTTGDDGERQGKKETALDFIVGRLGNGVLDGISNALNCFSGDQQWQFLKRCLELRVAHNVLEADLAGLVEANKKIQEHDRDLRKANLAWEKTFADQKQESEEIARQLAEARRASQELVSRSKEDQATIANQKTQLDSANAALAVGRDTLNKSACEIQDLKAQLKAAQIAAETAQRRLADKDAESSGLLAQIGALQGQATDSASLLQDAQNQLAQAQSLLNQKDQQLR